MFLQNIQGPRMRSTGDHEPVPKSKFAWICCMLGRVLWQLLRPSDEDRLPKLRKVLADFADKRKLPFAACTFSTRLPKSQTS